MRFPAFRSCVSAAALSAAAWALSACGGGSDGPAPRGQSHVYTQTNETENKVIHFARNNDGTLVEIERVATGGAGTSGFKPFTGEASAPDNLVSAGSVALSADNRYLFAVNAIDHSVSSFEVGTDGKLRLADHQPTGETSTPSSVTYNSKTRTLFVLHTTGPNHIRSFKVIEGKLLRDERAYTVNTAQFDDRVATQIVSTPDDRFVLVNVPFNTSPPNLTPSDSDTRDGLMVFPVQADGSLGTAVANDAGGAGAFGLGFLRGSSNVFVNTLAVGSGAVLSKLGDDGKVRNTKLSPVDLSRAPKGPSETCWVSLSPDNRYAYAANFSLGNITSFSLDGESIRVAADDQGFVAGDGNYKGAAGIVTSGPVDSWASKDGYLYQLYPNARQLVAYRMNGAQLEKIGSYPVPYDSTDGLTGF